MCQGQVEQLDVDPCQLVYTCFEHCPWDAIWSSSFPVFYCPQICPHLVFLEREGRGVGVLERQCVQVRGGLETGKEVVQLLFPCAVVAAGG